MSKRERSQAAFDAAAVGMLNQGRQSTDNQLNHRDGSMCAYGHLGATMDSLPGPGMYDIEAVCFSQLPEDLMRVHDRNPPEDWPELLERVAAEHGLDSEVVDMWEEQL